MHSLRNTCCDGRCRPGCVRSRMPPRSWSAGLANTTRISSRLSKTTIYIYILYVTWAAPVCHGVCLLRAKVVINDDAHDDQDVFAPVIGGPPAAGTAHIPVSTYHQVLCRHHAHTREYIPHDIAGTAHIPVSSCDCMVLLRSIHNIVTEELVLVYYSTTHYW